jgi:hypothetical protein
VKKDEGQTARKTVFMARWGERRLPATPRRQMAPLKLDALPRMVLKSLLLGRCICSSS